MSFGVPVRNPSGQSERVRKLLSILAAAAACVFSISLVISANPQVEDLEGTSESLRVSPPPTSDVPTEEPVAAPALIEGEALLGAADEATPEPIPPPPPPSEEEQWAARLDQLEQDLLAGARAAKDADVLYEELSQLLKEKRRRFRLALLAAIRGRALEEAQTQHRVLVSLYDIRLRLLRSLTPARRADVLGSGFGGTGELKSELDQVTLELRYQRILLPQLTLQWLDRVRQAPLPVVRQFGELILALVLFRVWRGWAKRGLSRLQKRLVEARPRTQFKLRTARLVWYLQQVRRPLEWLALVEIAFYVLDLSLIPGTVERISAVLRWSLLAWFLVRLIHSIGARGKSDLSGEVPRLRLRSLRVLAIWVVLLGMGLDIAESYAGRGTLRAWVWMTFQVLMLPLLALLVVWWRSTIFQRLEREPRQLEWIRRLLLRRKGLRGYLSAAVGGVYLLGLGAARALLSILALSDWGRALQSHWYRMGIARAAARGAAEQETKPLPDEIRSRLREISGDLVEKAGRDQLRRLAELAERGAGGVIAVVADRGFGKTVLLRRLSSALDKKILVVECPPGGSGSLLRVFARELGGNERPASGEAVSSGLDAGGYDVVAIDSYHRLVRPVMGGQAEIDVMAEVAHGAPPRLLWIVTLNRVAWRYIRRARSHQLAMEEVLELPAWTEQQIGELIDARTRAAQIDPDFEQLVLPYRLGEPEYPTLAERNRASVYRLIWDISGGNPSTALQLWADSLGLHPDGTVFVRVPHLPQTGELETVSTPFLLILRVIMQCELATREDIVESLRLSADEVRTALRFMLLRDWIEVDDERYRISDNWYGTVTRVLNRRNLITAREGVGLI